jgi:1,4-alpha-glucan branching enzyme
MKWNMGWMHDTLEYMRHDAIHRKYHHDSLSFGPVYVFTENFISPLSHDEVVHGKGSLLSKMSGGDWQQFANLRLLFTFQWTYPGKKLLFMGGELGQPWEWNHREPLPWHLLDDPAHAGISALLADLNRIYRSHSALQKDSEGQGFYWLSWEDRANSVLSFARRDGGNHMLVILNFTPVPREGYRIGAPFKGTYREIFNSDSSYYGGSNYGNIAPLSTTDVPAMGQAHSLVLTVPPLAGIILAHEPSG